MGKKLSTIIKQNNIVWDDISYKILIDGIVEQDENGNYLLNVAYERVSTEGQVEKYGLDIQEKDIMGYAKSTGLGNLLVFIDDGVTGTTMDRPALNNVKALIMAYNAGQSKIRINRFTVARLDRLGRTLLGTLEFIQEYILSAADQQQAHKTTGSKVISKNKETINFNSVAESFCRVDSGDPMGKMMLAMFAMLAEYDRDQIVRKLSEGKKVRAKKGYFPGGGGVPYGYYYDANTGKLEINPEEAEKVKEVFRLYLDERMPPEKIAIMLGFSHDSHVRLILKRETYVGTLNWGSIRSEDAYEPIIDRATYDRAQMELKARSSNRGSSNYLLSGIVYCGHCGGHMRYQQWGPHGRKKLVCYATVKSSKARFKKAEDCPQGLFWADEVEAAVLNKLLKMQLPEVKEVSTIKAAATSTTKQDLEKEKKRLASLYNLVCSEEEDGGVSLQMVAESKKRIAELTKQFTEEQERAVRSTQAKQVVDKLKNLEDKWPTMTEKQRQNLFHDVIEKVEIFNNHLIRVHLVEEKVIKMLAEEQGLLVG